MNSLYHTRPFNVRYVIWQRGGRYTSDMLHTHRTAKASYAYINRRTIIDEVGPTPDWASRDDLIASGRCGPRRANDPRIEGERLWAMMDDLVKSMRPEEPTLTHAVGSLPLGEDLAGWRNIIEGFCEDHLCTLGMLVDWAIHARPASADAPEILPHVHFLITTRVYDPANSELGRRRQHWLRTPEACKRLAERWYAYSGMVPASLIPAAF